MLARAINGYKLCSYTVGAIHESPAIFRVMKNALEGRKGACSRRKAHSFLIL